MWKCAPRAALQQLAAVEELRGERIYFSSTNNSTFETVKINDYIPERNRLKSP